MSLHKFSLFFHFIHRLLYTLPLLYSIEIPSLAVYSIHNHCILIFLHRILNGKHFSTMCSAVSWNKIGDDIISMEKNTRGRAAYASMDAQKKVGLLESRRMEYRQQMFVPRETATSTANRTFTSWLKRARDKSHVHLLGICPRMSLRG